MAAIINEKGQAMPEKVIPITKEAFERQEETNIRWLGSAGIMIHSRGTNILIDPLLEGFDMPLLIEAPMRAKDVPKLDAVLVTHIDNDHFSRPTCKVLKSVCKDFHAPKYVAEEMIKETIPGTGHDIKTSFSINNMKFTLTPVEHNWQNYIAKYQYREWKLEDYCGYYIHTEDGTIWLPGDSKLLEEQLKMPEPDAILFDFSDSEVHITLDGAVKMAACYPNADLICIHWGTVDSPEMSVFCGNPNILRERVVNPKRVRILDPGEAFTLQRHEHTAKKDVVDYINA